MNLGMPEMLFIFLLALLLFGPKKLPQMSRELGKALNEFKRASNEFKNQLETEIAQVEAAEHEKASFDPGQRGVSGRPACGRPIPGPSWEKPSSRGFCRPPNLPLPPPSGKLEKADPSRPAASRDSAHDSDLAPSNLAAVRVENTGSVNFNKAPLRESNA